MRDFLIAVIGTAAIILVLWLGAFYFGFYIDLHPNQKPEALFFAENGEILRPTSDGEAETVSIRAVDVSASLPGHPFSECEPNEEDYLRWFGLIGEMGANAVQADCLMDEDFYNALWTYNTSVSEPLWFIQCLSVSDEANFGKYDAYHADFLDRLIRDGKIAVDIIHGRRNISVGAGGAVGYYRKDISRWTLGYIIGYEWNADTIAYTDHSAVGTGIYEGKYISAPEGSSRFEAALAQAMDEVVDYESSKYKEQRLISFANSPASDPFEYNKDYTKLMSKYCSVDGEHLSEKDFCGLFVSYRLFGVSSDPLGQLSDSQLDLLGETADNIDRTRLYGGYMELLRSYHSLPVYIMGYGFSTSRSPTVEGESPLTEEKQGRELVRVWREADDLGFSGVCISSWQDTWERRSWNTAFSSDLTHTSFWHDLQSEAQNFGLLDFSPGEEPVCVLDGSADEWKGQDPVFSIGGGLSVYARYDAEGLYLLVKGDDLEKTKVYIPIDVTPESGSSISGKPELSFEREADFLLTLDGRSHTNILVHERYDAFYENFGEETLGINPFYEPPELDSPLFNRSRVAVSKRELTADDLTANYNNGIRLLEAYDIGRLVHGIGDPDSEYYNSLADFCFGEDCAEIRIPWFLLNFYAPSDMSVHRDYYEEYGVLSLDIDEIWIGAGTGEDTIPMFAIELEGWDSVVWRERLKKSYFVVQSAWREAEE